MIKGFDEIRKAGSGQQGIVLISSLLLLLVLSLMAIGLSMDSSMNVRIAGYQRLKARSFGYAESALMTTGDILEDNIYDAGWDDAVPFEYPNLSPGYTGNGVEKVEIVNDGAFYMAPNQGTDGEGDTMIEMRGVIEADVVTQRLMAKPGTGAALQVAAGYAGIGKSLAGGGAHILYNVRATGIESNGTKTELAMHYRVVTK